MACEFSLSHKPRINLGLSLWAAPEALSHSAPGFLGWEVVSLSLFPFHRIIGICNGKGARYCETMLVHTLLLVALYVSRYAVGHTLGPFAVSPSCDLSGGCRNSERGVG